MYYIMSVSYVVVCWIVGRRRPSSAEFGELLRTSNGNNLVRH